VSSKYLPVGDMDAIIVQIHGASIVDVHVCGDADQKDKERDDQHGNVVLFHEEESGERDTDVV